MSKRLSIMLSICVISVTGLVLFFQALAKSANNTKPVSLSQQSLSIKQETLTTEKKDANVLMYYLVLRNMGYFKAH